MFGQTLREWRTTRRLSQLDLALAADVSSRHISFLETGRASPSKSMVMHLAETLDVPRRSRNALLAAAGFAPAFAARPVDAPDLAPVIDAIGWTLDRHDPYPAFTLDETWHLQSLNSAAARLLSAVGLEQGDSLIDALSGPMLRSAIENWPEVAHYTALRLQSESNQAGGIEALSRAAGLLSNDSAVQAFRPTQPAPAFVPAIYALGEVRLSLISTLAAFSTAEDIALADLRIELMFPADEASKETLLAMANVSP